MATIPLGEAVSITAEAIQKLRLLPSAGATFVAVHPGALKSPANPHTQVVAITDNEVEWLGAFGEELLVPRIAAPRLDARRVVQDCLLKGARLWHVVLPGGLVNPGVQEPFSTVYAKERPWLVIGEANRNQPIAVPLNDATNPKWYAPLIRSSELGLTTDKDAQLELAHAWTIRPSATTIGSLDVDSQPAVGGAITKFYS
jgi:hypothetical protein